MLAHSVILKHQLDEEIDAAQLGVHIFKFVVETNRVLFDVLPDGHFPLVHTTLKHLAEANNLLIIGVQLALDEVFLLGCSQLFIFQHPHALGGHPIYAAYDQLKIKFDVRLLLIRFAELGLPVVCNLQLNFGTALGRSVHSLLFSEHRLMLRIAARGGYPKRNGLNNPAKRALEWLAFLFDLGTEWLPTGFTEESDPNF